MIQDAPTHQRLSTATILGFSGANLPLGALAVAVSVFLPAHFAKHLGVSLAVIGSAWATVRLLDIIVDPVLGMVMDRTRTRFGRYRAWMMIGAPILMIAIYALFMAPVGIGEFYLVGWLLIYYLGTSILGLGHSAWGATLSTEYHERSRVFGIVAAIGVLGASVILVIPIGADLFKIPDAQTVPVMGWFIIASIPITVLLLVARTPETVAREVAGLKFKIRDYWVLLAKPDLLRLFLAQMALTLGPGWMSALYVFFFTDARGYSGAEASIMLLVYILVGIAGAPMTAVLARRISKHRTLMVTSTAYSLGLCLILLIPKGNFPLALPVLAWCGFMAAGFDLMIRAMLADVGDEVRLDQGQERLSLIYALNSLAAKIASAFAIGLTYPLLGQLGYKAASGSTNTPQAIHSLELAFIVGPIIFVMLGGACVIGWRLDEGRHRQIRHDLDRRDAAFAQGD